MSDRPHSEEYFGEARDYWWNADQLALLASRWGLGRATSLLDVGCGVGHWSRLLYPLLAPGAELTGLDREPRWVAEAGRRFQAAFPEATPARFLEGDALALPFADASFDAVTCQTVLMHLRDAEAGLRELVRVVRPGGLVICAEPNNLYNCLRWSEGTRQAPAGETAALFEFWLRYHQGKEALGQGDNCVGERLPGLFQSLGLVELQTYLDDRVNPMYPPYARPEQRADLAAMEAWKTQGVGPWDEGDLREKYLAGGGTEAGLARALELMTRQWAVERDLLERRAYRAAAGSLFYVVSGRKVAR